MTNRRTTPPKPLAEGESRSVLSYSELEAAINTLADGVSVYDKQLRVLYQNRVIVERYGPALWEKCYSAYHHRSRVCDDCPAVKTLQDGKVHTTIRRTVHDGRVRYWELRSSPMFNERGEVIAVAEVTRDITKRETLRLELEAALEKVTRQQKQIEADLALAERVHSSLIPRSFHDEHLHMHVHYVPVQGVGGDYADIVPLGDGLCYTIIFDISGHGIAPALLANRVSGEINRMVGQRLSPAALAAEVNAFLIRHFNETGLYLTFFCCLYDLAGYRLTYSGGGHPPGVLLRNEAGTMRSHLLRSQNGILGAFPDTMAPEPETTIALRPDDKIVLFTDGLMDAGQSLGIPMTLPGLVALFESAAEEEPKRFADTVIQQTTGHIRDAVEDDITLMIAQVK